MGKLNKSLLVFLGMYYKWASLIKERAKLFQVDQNILSPEVPQKILFFIKKSKSIFTG